MSEPITVSTLFSDISELARAFVDRVREDGLMLPSSAMVPEGEWVQFFVLLNDGTTAFAGLGRSTRNADRGEAAPPATRYEVSLDSLRFEEASQRVFDHLLLVSRAIKQAEALPEQDASSDEWNDEELAAAEIEQLSAASRGEDEGAGVAEAGPAVAAPAQPAEPEKNPYAGSILKRPVISKVWRPEAMRPSQRPRSSGLFRYNGGGLPRPARPPRPELDPAKKVTRAPRPEASRAEAPAAVAAPTDSSPPAAGTGEIAAAIASSRPDPAASAHEPSPAQEPAGESADDKYEADSVTPVEPLEQEELTPVEPHVPVSSPPFLQEQSTAEIQDEELQQLLSTSEEPRKKEKPKSSRPPKPPRGPRRRR